MRLLPFIFAFLLFLNIPTFAKDDSSDQPSSVSSSRPNYFAWAFIRGVVSGQSYNTRLLIFQDLYVTRAAYPWLYPHLVPENGLPKPLAVNKWTQPINISFGMPNDLEPFEEMNKEAKKAPSISGKKRIFLDKTREGKWNGLYYELNDPIADIKGYRSFPVAEDEVKAFSEVVSPVIGLSVSYLAPELETKENYGNIRINLFKDDVLAANKISGSDHGGLYNRESRPKPKFNTVVTGVGAPPWFDFQQLEPLLNTRLSFNNFGRHVEGYFLSNEKNEIQMAVCYIWEGHKPEILRGLIRECLLRSMGFPGLTNRGFKEISLLGEWNQQNGNGPKPEYLEYFSQPFALTEKDRRFLELLYSESIQPGMDYIALYKTLENLQK